MLDLGLEHLGVDVGSSSSDVQLVLKGCGESEDDLKTLLTAPDKLDFQRCLNWKSRLVGALQTRQRYSLPLIRSLLVRA